MIGGYKVNCGQTFDLASLSETPPQATYGVCCMGARSTRGKPSLQFLNLSDPGTHTNPTDIKRTDIKRSPFKLNMLVQVCKQESKTPNVASELSQTNELMTCAFNGQSRTVRDELRMQQEAGCRVPYAIWCRPAISRCQIIEYRIEENHGGCY